MITPPSTSEQTANSMESSLHEAMESCTVEDLKTELAASKDALTMKEREAERKDRSIKLLESIVDGQSKSYKDLEAMWDSAADKETKSWLAKLQVERELLYEQQAHILDNDAKDRTIGSLQQRVTEQQQTINDQENAYHQHLAVIDFKDETISGMGEEIDKLTDRVEAISNETEGVMKDMQDAMQYMEPRCD